MGSRVSEANQGSGTGLWRLAGSGPETSELGLQRLQVLVKRLMDLEERERSYRKGTCTLEDL